jgi:hypothetical protein
MARVKAGGGATPSGASVPLTAEATKPPIEPTEGQKRDFQAASAKVTESFGGALAGTTTVNSPAAAASMTALGSVTGIGTTIGVTGTPIPEKTSLHENPGLNQIFAKSAESEGEEVDVTWPEEIYGKPGSFSSYRVGPFNSKSRVRAGETRPQAMRRVLDELAQVAAYARTEAKREFLGHFKVAFE